MWGVAALSVATGASPVLAGPLGRGATVLAAGAPAVTAPHSPVGTQLKWLLGVGALLPLTAREESAHFDATFVAAEPVNALNSALGSLGATGSKVTLVGLYDVSADALRATVSVGATTYAVQLAVDSKGLISGLYLSLVTAPLIPLVTSWTQLDKDLSKMAPHASFLAARLNPDGTCAPQHSVDAAAAMPLGSMFKLFILGALAHAVESHAVSWRQELTVTAKDKVGGSGELQGDPDGTTLTVEQAAVKMISLSDNTAADMLLALVGRGAVERQVRDWSSHAQLDDPFLSVAEMFVLKWHDYPLLADHYLSLRPAQRLAYLTSTIDSIPDDALTAASSPRDITSIEWFASADDICRAFAGLSSLRARSGLGPISTILSTNNGGIGLRASTWPQVWFKGGSEPGVLTLGYLARDTTGRTFVVVVMLDDVKKAIPSSSTLLGLGVVAGALGLLHKGEG